MAVTYTLSKNLNAEPAATYVQLIDILSHLAPLGAVLQRFELKPDGIVQIQLRDPLPADQIPHLGLS